MPSFDIVERHRIRVDAPAEVTLAAASEIDLLSAPIVRAIVRAREIALGATLDFALSRSRIAETAKSCPRIRFASRLLREGVLTVG